jgi:hypothetical protein
MEEVKKLFDMLSNDIKGERVPSEGIPCDVCSNPNYLGKTDVVYEYEYCDNCGRVLSETCGDYIESDYYGDDPGDY